MFSGVAIGREIHAKNMRIPSDPASADRSEGYNSQKQVKVKIHKGKGKRPHGERERGKGKRAILITLIPLDIQCVRTKRNDFPDGSVLAALTPPTSDNCPNYTYEL